MHDKIKMSRYNMITCDDDGGLLVYNFMKGISSLAKVEKCDVGEFRKLFIEPTEISKEASDKYRETIDVLLKTGILVYADVNEDVLLDEMNYAEIFDSKLNLTILPTGKCNFRCPYCFETPQSFSRETMTKDSQDAIIKYIQRSVTHYHSLHISWFGGEPLVASNVIKYLSEHFISICRKRYISYSADIVTNGYLLDADIFDMLYSFKVYEYMITLDGFKDQHDKRRYTANGKGSYDIILRNLMRIRDNKKYRFAHVMIRVNMSRGFLETMDEFVNYLSTEFGDDPRFRVMFVPVVNFKGSEFPKTELYQDHKKLFSYLYNNENYLKSFDYDDMKFTSIIAQDKCLSALKNMYLISPDLRVYKCNAHYDMKENQLGYMDLNGNMYINETLNKCWYMTRQVMKDTPAKCKECFYLPCCPEIYSGCPVSYISEKSDDISCPIKTKEGIKKLEDTVRDAAKKYSCMQIILKT